jgi:hypothetical protein
LTARLALLLSLGIAWLNLLLTSRWAEVPGSLNGPKYPFYLAALGAASILAWGARPERVRIRTASLALCWGALAFLAFSFFRWFPSGTWARIPFLDDWPPRFQSTLEGLRMLEHGAFAGWRWGFLGGYPTATDVTQDLTVWAAVPMWLLGPEAGFHATHLLLFLAIPALVWVDLRFVSPDGREEADLALLGAALAALFSTNYSYFLIRSGDTNSLAGVVSALATLVAAHAARVGTRGAAFALVLALTITNYSHRGFFVYTLLFLALDAVVSRDWRSAARAAVATVTALVASLPLTWDLWRYPSYYIINNVELRPSPFSPLSFLRSVYYNVELLFRPGRWFNDYTGIVNVFLPVIAFVAWKARGRTRLYALSTLAAVALVRLNYSYFGYAFVRPIHLLPVFAAPALGWFVLRGVGRRPLAAVLLALFALYIQTWLVTVPHVRTVRDFDPALVDRLAALDGNLLLVENAFHRDVDASPDRASLPTPFGVHYEALLPDATARRFYAGMWDGWQWTPYRDQVFANGTFRGRALSEVPVEELAEELRRWGVRHLVVWSEPAKSYLQDAPRFVSRWHTARWQHFELLEADDRAVVTSQGRGVLEDTGPFGATVRLFGVGRGDRVTVRTNYHPAWRASADGAPVAITDADGQLAFASPLDGDVVVRLEYPRRRWLLVVALIAIVGGGWLARRFDRRRGEGEKETTRG